MDYSYRGQGNCCGSFVYLLVNWSSFHWTEGSTKLTKCWTMEDKEVPSTAEEEGNQKSCIANFNYPPTNVCSELFSLLKSFSRYLSPARVMQNYAFHNNILLYLWTTKAAKLKNRQGSAIPCVTFLFFFIFLIRANKFTTLLRWHTQTRTILNYYPLGRVVQLLISPSTCASIVH